MLRAHAGRGMGNKGMVVAQARQVWTHSGPHPSPWSPHTHTLHAPRVIVQQGQHGLEA